jgi:peptidoglycan hydrolase-like protein with peptidoglycan-binding domain
MNIKDYIKTADAYGTETRALQEKRDAEIQEGWFDDAVNAVKNALGITPDEAEKIVDKKQADAGEQKSGRNNARTGKVAKPGSMGGTTAPAGGGADAATQGVDGAADATAAATQGVDGVAGGQAVTPASATTEPEDTRSLMKQYQDGGKKAMPEIKKLQQDLLDAGFDPNGVDGKYGNGTFKAVQDFQKSKGLTVDGAAGKETLAALAGNTATAQAPAGPDPETQKTIDALNNLLQQINPTQVAGGDPEIVATSADQDEITSMRGAMKLAESLLYEATEEQIKQLGDLLNKLGGTAWAQANGAEYQKYVDAVNKAIQTNPAQPAAPAGGATDAEKAAGAGAAQGVDGPADATAAATQGGDATAPADTNADAQAAAQSQMTKDPAAAPAKVSKELYIQSGTSAANFNVAQMKKKYPSPYIVIPQANGTVIHGYGEPANLQAYAKTKKGSKIVDKNKTQATPPKNQGADRAAPTAGDPGIVTTSKDNNMNKKAIKEASMNISMNGNNSAEVAELLSMLKNAGMPNAAPVSSMMDEPPMDKHDDMVSKIKMMEPPSDDSPCGMGEENIEEWENTPDGYRDEEEYGTTQSITKDASGGIHRPKPQGAIRVKDPAVALETSIKQQLYKALQEKLSK